MTFRVGVAFRSVAGRPLARRAMSGSTSFHLGSGDHLIPGWTNVDALGLPGVVTWDLTKPLPVAAGSVERIFSEHFIEHITRDEAMRWLADCHRVLRPGGVIRISTPDLQKLVDEYLAGRLSEWSDVNWNPMSPCQMVNEAVRSWGHMFVYDFRELDQVLREVGFSHVERVPYRESQHELLRGLERRPHHGEVILEATK